MSQISQLKGMGKKLSTQPSPNITDSSTENTNFQLDQKEYEEGKFDPYLTLGIKKDYVNMGDVEHEKLAWMKDLPRIHTQKVMSKLCKLV